MISLGGEKKVFFKEFWDFSAPSLSLFFLIISVNHSFSAGCSLTISAFFFQSCLLKTKFPFFTFLSSVLLCSSTCLEITISKTVCDSLDSTFDNILTALLSLSVAICDFSWIFLHICQRAAVVGRNIRSCGMQNMNSRSFCEGNA